MRPLLYGDPVKPYEIIVGLCICGRHRKSNAAISRARRKFNQTLAPYRHNAAVESDLAPRFGGCAAGFGLGREFTLSAKSCPAGRPRNRATGRRVATLEETLAVNVASLSKPLTGRSYQIPQDPGYEVTILRRGLSCAPVWAGSRCCPLPRPYGRSNDNRRHLLVAGWSRNHGRVVNLFPYGNGHTVGSKCGYRWVLRQTD
jgi:hypothetical protein